MQPSNKKLKGFDGRGAVARNAVVPASALSPTASIMLPNIKPKRADESLFFPDDTVAQPSITCNLKKIFGCKNEKTMRDRLFLYLVDEHKINSPGLPGVERADDGGTLVGRLTRSAKKFLKPRKYSEKSMKNLLNVHVDKGHSQKLNQKVLVNLPITTASQCDAAILRPITCTGVMQAEVVLGEAKNKENKTLHEALAQAFLYMMAYLRWLRVQKGLAVDSVFGFTVCGSMLKEVEFYNVSLLKLTAPSELGECFQYQYATYMASSFDDTEPLAKLVRFFKNGKQFDYGEHLTPIDEEERCSSLMLAPKQYWLDNNESGLNLVRNGTMAVVLRGTKQAVFDALSRITEKRMISVLKSELALGKRSRDDDDGQWYLKFQIHGFNNGSNIKEFMKAHEKLMSNPGLKATYHILPFTKDDCYIIVMPDRGTNAHSFSQWSEFAEAFKNVWNTAMFLCTVLKPCDTLPHNMVYSEKEKTLHLIDVEEGSDDTIKERIVESKNDLEVARYPNFLREHEYLYALVQLSCSIVWFADNKTFEGGGQTEEQTATLVEHLSTIGKAEMQWGGKAPAYSMNLIPKNVRKALEGLRNTMFELLGLDEKDIPKQLASNLT